MNDMPLIKQFLHHQSDFMAYLMAITRDFHAAEEVFQDAAVVVLKHAESGGDIRHFRAWAKEIVRRQALRYMQQQIRQKRHVRPVDPELLEQINRVFIEDGTPESVLHGEISALEACIKKMPDTGRKMLAMRYEKRATFVQIADAVKKTEAAVQRALCRLRRALHDCVRSRMST